MDDTSDNCSIVPEIALMACTEFVSRRLDAADLLADLAGRLGCLFGECLDLGGDDREATAGFAGTCGLDGRVESQQICLTGDRIDQVDHVADLGGGLRELTDLRRRGPGLVDGR